MSEKENIESDGGSQSSSSSWSKEEVGNDLVVVDVVDLVETVDVLVKVGMLARSGVVAAASERLELMPSNLELAEAELLAVTVTLVDDDSLDEVNDRMDVVTSTRT
jgi:hypothetical protein